MHTKTTPLALKLLLTLLFLSSGSAFAAPGALDTTFSGDGKLVISMAASGITEARSVIQQKDGRLVIAGEANGNIALARVTASGVLDASFSGDGMLTTAIASKASGGYSVIQQTDGKLVVAGAAHINGNLDANLDFAVVRYNSDGSLDTTFNVTGIVTTPVGTDMDVATSIIQQKDGKLAVAGYSKISSKLQFSVVRYNSNGTLDTSFNTTGIVKTPIGSGDSSGEGIVQQSDGKLVVAGTTSNGTDTDFALVRYTSAGAIDTTFDRDAVVNGNEGIIVTAIGTDDDVVHNVRLQKDGKILVVGSSLKSGQSNNPAVARYNTTGIIDLTFAGTGFYSAPHIGGAVDESAFDVLQQPDGKIVLSCSTVDPTNGRGFCVERFLANGTLDNTFSGNGKAYVNLTASAPDHAYSMTLQTDGNIVLAGTANNQFGIARLVDTDTDGDGYQDNIDAFPLSSGEWIDTDGDGIGNNADTDDDGDGTPDGTDAFPTDPTETTDTDTDGIGNNADNCPSVSNASQLDSDGDLQGDACDADRDGDGVPNGSDLYPDNPNESADTDADGIGNNGDNCPADANPTQTDTDGDGIGDVCDPVNSAADTDADGFNDGVDNCPVVANADQADTDGDGVGNVCDNAPNDPNTNQQDTDSDTIGDAADNCPVVANADQADTDGDGVGNVCDNAPNISNPTQTDTDADGIGDVADNCPADVNSDQLNTDGDANGDACDTDDDGDSVLDVNDAFPLDPTESVDTDSDGTGNNADTDDDGDSVPDVDDAFPTDPGESLDTDTDTIGDNADNCSEAANLDQADTDLDSIGDLCDQFPNDAYVLGSSMGSLAKNLYGTAVAFAGDVDGDGRDDVIVGSYKDDQITLDVNNKIIAKKKDIGSVRVISVAKNKTLYTLYGLRAGDWFGYSVSPAGDLNADGFDDFIVGSPRADVTVVVENKDKVTKANTGKITVFSGKDGAVLLEKFGTNANDQFGFSVANAGDFDDATNASKKHTDYVVGSPLATATTIINEKPVKLKKAGNVAVISGFDGSIVMLKSGTKAGQQLGFAVAGLGDLNADNHSDIAASSPFAATERTINEVVVVTKKAGKVDIYSGLDTALLYSVQNDTSNANLGFSIANAADINDDGINDIAIGIPNYNNTIDNITYKKSGKAIVVSGADGSTRLIEKSGTTAGEGFGYSVAGAGLVDDDNFGDFLVGSIRNDSGALNAGSFFLYSGDTSNGNPTILNDAAGFKNDAMGFAVSGGGDANADGYNDIVIAAPKNDQTGKDIGKVFVLSGAATIVP